MDPRVRKALPGQRAQMALKALRGTATSSAPYVTVAADYLDYGKRLHGVLRRQRC